MYFPFLSAYENLGSSWPFKNKNWHAPSLAYIFAGKGLVFENSKVTCPSHSGSSGVTVTIIPQRA